MGAIERHAQAWGLLLVVACIGAGDSAASSVRPQPLAGLDVHFQTDVRHSTLRAPFTPPAAADYGCSEMGTKCCYAATQGCPLCDGYASNPSSLFGCQVSARHLPTGADRKGKSSARQARNLSERFSGIQAPQIPALLHAARTDQRHAGRVLGRQGPPRLGVEQRGLQRGNGRAAGAACGGEPQGRVSQRAPAVAESCRH